MSSATIGADRRPARLLALGLLGALLSTCAPAPPSGPAPQAAAEPEVRIGLAVGAGKLRIASDAPLTVLDAEGSLMPDAPGSAAWVVVPDGAALALLSPSGWRSPPQTEVTFAPTGPATSVSFNERGYRGRILILRDRTGLTAVNRIGLESYLAGVVSSEMGRRDSTEEEALAAQAVVSRTFAIRNRGKRRDEGFDLYATVVDQVYGGIASESAQSWKAVRETAGRILTFKGAPIDAFFFSTCGGRTADGTEVFVGASRPYLRTIRDEDATGRAYCALSPRFRWREEWTAEELAAILQRTLPAVIGTPASAVTEVSSVQVTKRTGSDRVAEIAIRLGRTDVLVDGPAVRQVLRPKTDPALRSSGFSLTETRADDRLVRLVAEGVGAGHGVGFCQWGAVGRARAGQHYQEILGAYYNGAEIERLY